MPTTARIWNFCMKSLQSSNSGLSHRVLLLIQSQNLLTNLVFATPLMLSSDSGGFAFSAATGNLSLLGINYIMVEINPNIFNIYSTCAFHIYLLSKELFYHRDLQSHFCIFITTQGVLGVGVCRSLRFLFNAEKGT